MPAMAPHVFLYLVFLQRQKFKLISFKNHLGPPPTPSAHELLTPKLKLWVNPKSRLGPRLKFLALGS